MSSTTPSSVGTPAQNPPAAPAVGGPALVGLAVEPRAEMRPGRLQVFVAVSSVLLIVATALHTFAAFDATIIERGLVGGGLADPATATLVFIGLRFLGVAFLIGNALGILSLWARPEWLFGTVLGVNIVQALAWVVVPGEVWTAAQDAYGWTHTLPGIVVIGGALAVAVVLTATLLRRGPWGEPPSAQR